MLLVRDWMAREVVTVEPGTTAAALALDRQHGIRHLPVLEGERLIGLISNRNLRSVTSALDDPSRAEALQRIRVGDEMMLDVATARPEDPVEDAAAAMYERKIGCLPVMDGDGLVGIVTSSDVMRALARLVGVHEPGSRLEVALPDRPGSLARIAGITRDAGVNLVSVLVTLRSASGGQHITILRLATIDPGEMVEQLGEAGYSVLWPPETHLGGWRP